MVMPATPAEERLEQLLQAPDFAPPAEPRRMRRGWARRRSRCCGVPRGSLARRGPRRCATGPASRSPGRWPRLAGWAWTRRHRFRCQLGDKRFADPAWTASPAFFTVRQAHLAVSRLVADVLAAGAGDPVDDAKAALAAGFLLDAAAPTNVLATNPAAL